MIWLIVAEHWAGPYEFFENLKCKQSDQQTQKYYHELVESWKFQQGLLSLLMCMTTFSRSHQFILINLNKLPF